VSDVTRIFDDFQSGNAASAEHLLQIVYRFPLNREIK
jgi:hypothetical protein